MYSSDVFSEELENQTQTDGQSFQIKSIALFKSKSWLTDISSEQLVDTLPREATMPFSSPVFLGDNF